MKVLDGIRVLDLGIWRPAPFATQLLAELGAEVTKVEPPGGDPMRVFPDLYRTLNHEKRVVEHDLKDDVGRLDVLELAADSDVVVEGFRPGVADRLGIGFEEVVKVRPHVVYCSISGFGQDGPLAQLPGHDLNYQAWSGVLATRAPDVHRGGVPIGDLAGGTHAALAICAALIGRHASSPAVHLDVSMADVLMTWAAPQPGGDLVPSEGTDGSSSFPGYGTFDCADGHVTLGILTEQHFWTSLCEVLALDDLVAIETVGRAARMRELRGRIAAAFATRARDDVVAELVAAGVPVAPVLSPADATRLEHFVARGVSTPQADGSVELAHPVQFLTQANRTR